MCGKKSAKMSQPERTDVDQGPETQGWARSFQAIILAGIRAEVDGPFRRRWCHRRACRRTQQPTM